MVEVQVQLELTHIGAEIEDVGCPLGEDGGGGTV